MILKIKDYEFYGLFQKIMKSKAGKKSDTDNRIVEHDLVEDEPHFYIIYLHLV